MEINDFGLIHIIVSVIEGHENNIKHTFYKN